MTGKLKPPTSFRMMTMADALETDAAAIDRIADRLEDDYGSDLLALGRRLRRHAAALTGMAWEIDAEGGEDR
jgi:hypothetical protein